MPALASDLRKTLETTVVKARELAERGARDALTALAVDASEPFGSMSEEERKLRNRLRARGRQLGDQRDPQKGTQSIERLVREMAYEHWHRMLFARFLAENQLLIEPSSGVSISLDECEELAAEEGTDLWGLAAQYAQSMLPQIFRVDDPVLAAKLPLEIRQQLQGLVAGLETETFTASDSLGWTYQFWQTKRKKEVNDSGVKIGADEISPVTQLFTEDYMVDFLLDNTLGAWHAGKVLAANPQLAATAQSEEELRQGVALHECPWNYLRFIKTDDGAWTPAAGTFEGWPTSAAELKCMDPCMGSGHFVVAMFERMVALRMEEGVSEQTAVAAVIQGNLFGLEIDPRCTQIGAFNLALAAWRRVGHCKLPAMNLACSGLAPNTSEAEWLALAGDNERLRNGMKRLYRLFDKAGVLGSLIDPCSAENGLLEATFIELQPLLEQALTRDEKAEAKLEAAVTAHGIAKANLILGRKFTLVVTNVPYLGRRKQSSDLVEFSDKEYPLSSSDLSTCFFERCLKLCQSDGSAATVATQNWLFLGSYKGLRKITLGNNSWQLVAKLGGGGDAFAIGPGNITNIASFIVSNSPPSDSSNFSCIDASPGKTPSSKSQILKGGEIFILNQKGQSLNPDYRIGFELSRELPLLGSSASCLAGILNGDSPRFVRYFWEVDRMGDDYEPLQSTVKDTVLFGGRQQIIYWQKGEGTLRRLAVELRERLHDADRRGNQAWGKLGIAVSQIGKLAATFYTGEKFDSNVAVVCPKKQSDLPALWAYLSSSDFHDDVRQVDQKLNVTNSTFAKVPYDQIKWKPEGDKIFPNGLLTFPQCSDSTQWIFNGDPSESEQELQVAVARLCGYQWPRSNDSDFCGYPAIAGDALNELSDKDGIVGLVPVRGEPSADERLRNLLSASFGDKWSSEMERRLLLASAVDNNARTPEATLEAWLRNSFFVEHCKLFQCRPFIWQIWDGHPHGFSALVNYHKLASPNGQGCKTLELLTFTYLGDWIDRQKLDQAEGVNGADDRLAAALDLQGQLKKILEGEPPYDIFVRWKPLHQQAIGWDPDINDGVRLNIRPFLSAQLRKGGKTGAGILRAKPGTIKWAKDRGKEPMRSKDDFPWFWGWDENSTAVSTDFGAPVPGAPPAGDSFDGNRWNDLHYTREAKEAARDRHRGEA
jgi:hypothetical protein